jgi:hypothetical protein
VGWRVLTDVGRNDPCPCGSGKKYKKCCGGVNVAQLDHLILEDLERVFANVLDFAYERFEWKLEHEKQKVTRQLCSFNFETPGGDFLFYTWFLVAFKGKDHGTILESFINERLNTIPRTRVRDVVSRWASFAFVVGEVKENDGERMLVEDFMSSERFEFKGVDLSFAIGETVFTAAMPYENGQFVPFTTFFNFDPDVTTLAKKIVGDLFEDSSRDLQGFYRENFLRLIDSVFEKMHDEENLSVDSFTWRNELEENAGQELYSFVIDHNHQEEWAYLITKYLNDYFQMASARIRNPRIYAAALYYMCSEVLPILQFTQKELGAFFDVSPASISNRSYTIDEAIGERMAYDFSMLEQHGGPSLSFLYGNEPAPTEKTMWEIMLVTEDSDDVDLDQVMRQTREGGIRLPELTHKEEAQQLIYEAFEAQPPERYTLCEKALKVDADCADAYNLLAEKEKRMETKLKLLEKGMRLAKKEIRECFHDGTPFWKYVRTRPYMRLTLNLALALKDASRYDEAIHYMKQLMKLNAEDNQGVRYELIPLLIASGKKRNVEDLLDMYEEEYAYAYYIQFFMSIYFEKGNVKEKADVAVDENPFAMAYMTGVWPFPDELPRTYTPGSEEEGIVIAKQTGILWKDQDLFLKIIEKEGSLRK